MNFKAAKTSLSVRVLSAVASALAASFAHGQAFPVPDSVVSNAFAGRQGAFVVVDCASGATCDFRPAASSERLPPCSSFKVWNALVGLEVGAVSSAAEAFYKWDGTTRAVPEWNGDLTFEEAFRASCVPAFQSLARTIGPGRMQSWLDRIGYGDRDLSAGVDVFWLPAGGRKTILISPMEQAVLMRRLVTGDLPFRKESLAVLKDMMAARKTDRGVLYGKTGSGGDGAGKYVLGWFVGYVEGGGRTFAFACAAKGEGVMGKDARAIVEAVLEAEGLL